MNKTPDTPRGAAPPTRRCVPLILAAAVLAGAAHTAHASCGATFCTLMTDRYAQGSTGPHPGWSLDLRLESVTQDRLRSGTTNLRAADVTGEEALERRTRNLSTVAALTYGTDADWSITLRVPLLRRDHAHDLFDETSGLPSTPERWRFSRPGDVQVTARRRFGDGDLSWALYGGLKLPTGSTHVTNADGSRAERALQPGSGTVDVVLGAAARRALDAVNALVMQAGVTQALRSHEDFKPGTRTELSAGWSHAFDAGLGAVLQLNLRHRGRDQGAQAEPDNSGSTTLDLSPGLTVGVGAASTLYAYVQQPLYQKVNGIQLVPRRALAMGWTADF